MSATRVSMLPAILLLVACASSQPRFGAGGPVAGNSPPIRVLLAEGNVHRVSVDGPFEIRGGGVSMVRSKTTADILIRRNDATVEVRIEQTGGVAAVEGQVSIIPVPPVTVAVDGVKYRGEVRAVLAAGSGLLLNVLPVETYLEGVVPHEIGKPGPDAFAAVEAQAIAARTYALARMRDRAAEPFDVYAGVRDQVYRGVADRDPLAISAIRDTRGEVLSFDGHLARAYYSATCGGHTSDIRRVWPQREDADYLHGERDARSGHSHCEWVRNFRWRYSFSGKELGSILRKTLPAELGISESAVGSLVNLRVVERSPSGRVHALEIETTSGVYRVEGDRIRWVLKLDPDTGRILPSTLFDIGKRERGGQVTFVSIAGGGNGHGVGMCQNGAIGMARGGYTYRMILSHYYPGTQTLKQY